MRRALAVSLVVLSLLAVAYSRARAGTDCVVYEADDKPYPPTIEYLMIAENNFGRRMVAIVPTGKGYRTYYRIDQCQ